MPASVAEPSAAGASAAAAAADAPAESAEPAGEGAGAPAEGGAGGAGGAAATESAEEAEWRLRIAADVLDVEAHVALSKALLRAKRADAAVAHLMNLIENEPDAEAIPAKPEYPDWSFDREVCRAGGDGGSRAREQRKGVLA